MALVRFRHNRTIPQVQKPTGFVLLIGGLLVAFFLAKKRLHIAFNESFGKHTDNNGNQINAAPDCPSIVIVANRCAFGIWPEYHAEDDSKHKCCCCHKRELALSKKRRYHGDRHCIPKQAAAEKPSV